MTLIRTLSLSRPLSLSNSLDRILYPDHFQSENNKPENFKGVCCVFSSYKNSHLYIGTSKGKIFLFDIPLDNNNCVTDKNYCIVHPVTSFVNSTNFENCNNEDYEDYFEPPIQSMISLTAENGIIISNTESGTFYPDYPCEELLLYTQGSYLYILREKNGSLHSGTHTSYVPCINDNQYNKSLPFYDIRTTVMHKKDTGDYYSTRPDAEKEHYSDCFIGSTTATKKSNSECKSDQEQPALLIRFALKRVNDEYVAEIYSKSKGHSFSLTLPRPSLGVILFEECDSGSVDKNNVDNNKLLEDGRVVAGGNYSSNSSNAGNNYATINSIYNNNSIASSSGNYSNSSNNIGNNYANNSNNNSSGSNSNSNNKSTNTTTPKKLKKENYLMLACLDEGKNSICLWSQNLRKSPNYDLRTEYLGSLIPDLELDPGYPILSVVLGGIEGKTGSVRSSGSNYWGSGGSGSGSGGGGGSEGGECNEKLIKVIITTCMGIYVYTLYHTNHSKRDTVPVLQYLPPCISSNQNFENDDYFECDHLF